MKELLDFKGYMASHKITQQMVADALGITLANANLKLNGKQDISLVQIKTLCDKFGCNADIFL